MEKYRNVMRDTFGAFDFLCDNQSQAFEAIARGDKNVIVSMKSLGGKSFCYQICGATDDKQVTAVISPSLALIRTQIQYLNSLSLKALTINSDMKNPERDDIVENLTSSKPSARFFLFTREMFVKVKSNLSKMIENGNLARIVIDGLVADVDPRESFSSIREFRREHPEIQWVVLTTASESRIAEIAVNLNMVSPTVIKGPSTRKDTFYSVDSTRDFPSANGKILRKLKEMSTKGQVPSGIIFCKNADETINLAKFLTLNGVEARSFFAAKPNCFDDQDAWMRSEFPVLVATAQSFGNGIVKIPTKFVFHYGRPRNMDSFYQESGRAYYFYNAKVDSCIYDVGEDLDENGMDYIETKMCRRAFIGSYFNEKVADCGTLCDTCSI